MSWYSRYLSVFEKSFASVPEKTIEEVREKLQRFKCDKPLASLVVIGYNEETRLLSCLWSLSENIFNDPVEIIGVDNNSTDRTSDVFRATDITWYLEEKKSCGYARRCGLEHARGKYYICIDADTIYPRYYIQTLLNELKKPGIIGVSALWSFIPDKKNSRIGLYFYELLRDIHIKLISYKRPELAVRGMVFAYVAEYGRKVGYRVDIKRGEDGSMALGLKKYGRLKFILSRRARVATCTNTLNADGSLLNGLVIRIKQTLKSPGRYFSKREVYEDQESNLIERV